jgi:hypothetical protein
MSEAALTFRSTLRNALSRDTLQSLRSCRWHLSYYLPRLVTSKFVRVTPNIRGFGSASRESPLLKLLRNSNAVAATKMCRVMTKHGSDKGRGWHNYTTVYSALFPLGCVQPKRIFELGLGTNQPDLISTMGVEGRPGASLRGWAELFPNAVIYGADIDRGSLFQEPRIKTYYCDQLDSAAIRELWAQPDLRDGMDLLVEDGLHTFEANISFLDGSLEHVTPGGLYVIEDIADNQRERWYETLGEVYAKRYPTYEFAFVALPNSLNSGDNNMLIVRRHL